MELFLITLLITFVTLTGVTVLIALCKNRPRSGRHQLTGMCHRTGTEVCSSCSDIEELFP